jgi:hypothetical protein
MERHNSRNTRSLCNTVRDLCEQPEERNIADEFHNSLTGMAGQVQLNENSITEDLQTPERAREMKKKRDQAEKKLRKGAIKFHTNRRAWDKLSHADEDLRDIDSREKSDEFKLYGKGGKVVAKRSKEWVPVKEDALDEASKRQLAKADRDAKAKRVKRAAGKYVPTEKGKEDAAALYKRVTKGLSAGGYSYPKNMTEEEKKHKESIEDAMKRLAAKALKRARKKAGSGNKTDDAYAGEKPKARKYDPDMVNPGAIAEVAAPGTEDWASNPKVKKAFKERYGKRWKKVMYGRSWNMAKMDEETELAEGVKRLRRLRRLAPRSIAQREAGTSGRASRETADAYDKELNKLSASRLRRGGARKQTIRGFFKKGKPTTPATDKAFAEFFKGAMQKANAKGKKVFESEQLDEAGYKRLMRLRKAAYKADLASRSSVLDPTDARSQGKKHARLKRAAAEQEAKVAARMAMKGGASADAVRAGGSRIGKSGKYTAKAAGLAAQRDKALGKFRGMASGSKSREAVQGAFGMHNMNAETKRKKQQAQAAFEKKARTGDFGQNNQEGMRPLYNWLKRTGKLKTKGK